MEQNNGDTFRKYFAWVIILALAGYNYFLYDKGVNTLTTIYEWRIANLELAFKAQSKDINDCMMELPDNVRKEIYRKHREELAQKIEEYLKTHPNP